MELNEQQKKLLKVALAVLTHPHDYMHCPTVQQFIASLPLCDEKPIYALIHEYLSGHTKTKNNTPELALEIITQAISREGSFDREHGIPCQMATSPLMARYTFVARAPRNSVIKHGIQKLPSSNFFVSQHLYQLGSPVVELSKKHAKFNRIFFAAKVKRMCTANSGIETLEIPIGTSVPLHREGRRKPLHRRCYTAALGSVAL